MSDFLPEVGAESMLREKHVEAFMEVFKKGVEMGTLTREAAIGSLVMLEKGEGQFSPELREALPALAAVHDQIVKAKAEGR